MRTSVLMVLALVLATGCETLDGRNTVEGSGNVVSETRQVAGFDRISVIGCGTITIDVGPDESLTVRADGNALPHLVTEVDGSTLVFDSDASFIDVEAPEYSLTMPDLAGVSIIGSGEVIVSGFKRDTFTIDIAGSGGVIPVGAVRDLDVSITGSGGVDGSGLVAAGADVRITGSGSAVVNATGRLGVHITGSGHVTYLGTPSSLARSIVGSGSIEPG